MNYKRGRLEQQVDIEQALIIKILLTFSRDPVGVLRLSLSFSKAETKSAVTNNKMLFYLIFVYGYKNLQ
jgi:hypothetical protein